MTKRIALAVLILAGFAVAAEPSKYIIKVARVSVTEAAISCTNGADPTGTKVGNTVIISCGN
jgi:hypothetical protein